MGKSAKKEAKPAKEPKAKKEAKPAAKENKGGSAKPKKGVPEGQQKLTDANAVKKANFIMGIMKRHQPFHELDRWHALADAGLVADYWIEEVVDDDVETPVVRTVSY